MKKYIKSIKKYLFIQIICSTIATLSLALLPYIQKELFDSIILEEQFNVFFYVPIFIIATIISLLFDYLETIATWRGNIKFEFNLKKDFFSSIINRDYEDFISRDIGEYISLQGNEITQLEMDYLNPAVAIIKTIITVLIYSVILFVLIDWRIAITIIITSIMATVIFPNITAKELSKRRRNYTTKIGTYVSLITDLLQGFNLVNQNTKYNISKKHNRVLQQTADSRYTFGHLKTVTGIINGFSIYLIDIISFGLIAFLLVQKEITIGTAVATLGYVGSFLDPIQCLIADINTVKSTKHIKERVLSIINYNDSKDLIDKSTFDSNIVFDNVNIHYDNFKINNFSFTFEKGKKYALIGHNGSGKSTILKALAKRKLFYEGEIRIDNIEISKLDTDNIIYYMHQIDHIYKDDFLNNVTVFSSYDYSFENIKNLEIKKEKLDKIMDIKDTTLLSGGEKQIVSIIRLLLSNADIWLLDEPFSDVDKSTTQNIISKLPQTDKTVIMVTHDISSNLSLFDEVILLENGSIVATGTYDTICNLNSFKTLAS